MKKLTILLLFVICLFCVSLGFVACNEEYEIDVEGYTLQIEEDGTYSIIGIPSEILEQSTWRVPEQIGEYPISHLGANYRSHGMWAPSKGPGDLGRIRKIYIPACIKSVCLSTYFIKVWETEAPISQIQFKDDFPYHGSYLLSPQEDNENNYTYITQENVVDNMIIVKNDEETEATLLYAFGEGELTIPDTYQDSPITKIGEEALFGEKFTDVTLGANMKHIGEEAFYGVPISQIELIEGLETIGINAFKETELTSLVAPSTLQELGDGAFQGAKIVDLNLYDSAIQGIRYATFSGNPLTGVLKFPKNLKVIKGGFSGAEFTSVLIPDTVTAIYTGAFSGCNNLTEFILPDSVTDFSASAVSRCENLEKLHMGMVTSYLWNDPYQIELPKLKEITVSPENTGLTVEGGILYDKRKSILYKCPTLLNIEMLTLNSTTIKDYAFVGNPYIKYVELLPEVNALGIQAFENCSALERVVLSPNITSIEFATFRGCSSLKEINTENIRLFDGSCFHRCSSLQYADFTSATAVGDWAFYMCDLQQVFLGANCKNLGKLAFADNLHLKTLDRSQCPRVDIASNALYNTPLWVNDGKGPSNISKGCKGGFWKGFPTIL